MEASGGFAPSRQLAPHILWRLHCVSAERVFAPAVSRLREHGTDRLCLLCNCSTVSKR